MSLFNVPNQIDPIGSSTRKEKKKRIGLNAKIKALKLSKEDSFAQVENLAQLLLHTVVRNRISKINR